MSGNSIEKQGGAVKSKQTFSHTFFSHKKVLLTTVYYVH